jgi:hypothetical protein
MLAGHLVTEDITRPPDPPGPNHNSPFREAMSRHYKAERDRTEACLRDIVTILENKYSPYPEQISEIRLRLVKHYDR